MWKYVYIVLISYLIFLDLFYVCFIFMDVFFMFLMDVIFYIVFIKNFNDVDILYYSWGW